MMLRNVWEASYNLLDVYIAKELSLSHLKSFCYSPKSFAHLVKSCSCKGAFCFATGLTVSGCFAYFFKDNFPCVFLSFSQDGFSLYIGGRCHPEPQGTASLIFSLLCLLKLCLFRPKQTSKQGNCANYKPFRLFRCASISWFQVVSQWVSESVTFFQ